MNRWQKMRENIRNWRISEAPAARDPKKSAVKRLGQAIKGAGGSDFEDSPVDLDEIQRAYHTDSYIRRAVDKYAGLMFKQGWDFTGRNENAVEYLRSRLQLISEGTQKPTDMLFSEAAFDYVLYGNAFIVKARQKGASTSGINATGYTGKQPIAGYFLLPAPTVAVSRDDQGNITGYQQDVGGGEALSFKKEDMIHLVYRRPTGRAYGVPLIFNVLDDVQILRQLEENVARLVYRNLFPLYQYQVGIDKPGYEAEENEIEELREELRDMPMDGALVVPERHNISVVGAEGAAIDAEPYLKYYRQRVFTGLGMSDSVMGVGDTSNRSTSDNQASDLFDAVKEFQRTFAEQLQLHIIDELLFEGGFDPVMNPDDKVKFFFEEIELDAKMKKENHAMQLFMQNGIEHEEMRERIGLDPVQDESRLHFNMIGGQSAQSQEEGASNQSNNRDQPENQHGKQSSPGKPEASDDAGKTAISEKKAGNRLTEADQVVILTSELPIETYTESMRKFWSHLSSDVAEMAVQGKPLEVIQGLAIELVRESLRGQNRHHIGSAFAMGAEEARKSIGYNGRMSITAHVATGRVTAMSEGYINRLMDQMTGMIATAMKEENTSECRNKIISAFESNTYRLSFIARTELYRAYNYGFATVALEAGLDSVDVVSEDGCDDCMSRAGTIILSGVDMMDVLPPHHANCTCRVQLRPSTEEV